MLLARSPAQRPLSPTGGSILLEDVWVDHDGVDALCGISTRIHPHCITAVAGPNGSGKSTLLGVLAGILSPRSGSVSLPRRASTALVVQRSEVSDRMPLTVQDVVTMGRWAHAGLWRRLRRADHAIIDDCIGLVGLRGYEGRPLHALSGGQRQRAFLAQGLARQADLVLLDEPTTGLDASSRTVVAEVLAAEKARGATVICVSHDDIALQAADHVLRLDAGRVSTDSEVPAAGPLPGTGGQP